MNLDMEILAKLKKALDYADKRYDETLGEFQVGVYMGIMIATKIIDPTIEFIGYVDEHSMKEYMEVVEK